MIVLVTSCGRFDLLEKTLNSFTNKGQTPVQIIIHEDFTSDIRLNFKSLPAFSLVITNKIGQHASIETFLNDSEFEFEKYYVHLEDDWQFENSYDWIKESIAIMEADPKIIKVLCNSDSPHPCVYDNELLDNQSESKFGYLQPWENNGINWHGFSWNPGVTRLDLLKQFVPFPKYEQELAKEIYGKGYKVVRLEKGVCHHIGGGRSTHE